MKIPFICHSSGVQEIGNNSFNFSAAENEVVINLRDIIGDTPACEVNISLCDYHLTVSSVKGENNDSSGGIPLLHIICSSGDKEIFSVGQNPDAAGTQSLTLDATSVSSRAFETIKLMLDTSSLCQIARAFINLKPAPTDYLVSYGSPVASSIFVDNASQDVIEVISGTSLEKIFEDAFTKAEGLASSGCTLRISFEYPSPGAYHSQGQSARGIYTNSSVNTRFQQATGFFKADLCFDGTFAKTFSPTILTRPDGTVMRVRQFKIGAVGYNGSVVVGAVCLGPLITALSAAGSNARAVCYLTPLPTSEATLVGCLDVTKH